MKLNAPQFLWYCVCTKAMVISKGRYVYGELKTVLPLSVHKTHLPVCGRKFPCYMGGGLGRRMEKCGTSCTPIPMAPRLNQTNGYMKGKLREWRAQKCIALVVVENEVTSVGPKNSLLHGGRYRSVDGKNAKLRAPQSPWYRVCTKAMVI